MRVPRKVSLRFLSEVMKMLQISNKFHKCHNLIKNMEHYQKATLLVMLQICHDIPLNIFKCPSTKVIHEQLQKKNFNKEM
jgi:hypothetical protein